MLLILLVLTPLLVVYAAIVIVIDANAIVLSLFGLLLY